MNVTATTTDEDLIAPVTAARKALSDLALEASSDSETLAKAVNEVAAQEGRMEVRHTLRNALAHGATVEQTKGSLMQHLYQGADDTWSGRANDARRAKFDGVRAEVSTLTQFGRLERLFAAVTKEA